MTSDNKYRDKILFFDIDGTLIRVGGRYHFQAFEEAMKAMFDITADRKGLDLAGKFDRQIVVEILAAAKIHRDFHHPDINRACVEIAAAFERLTDGVDLAHLVLPGVIPLLTRLRELRYPIGLVTGNVEAVGWRKMKLAGIEHLLCPFGGFGDCNVTTRGQLVGIALQRAFEKIRRRYNPEDAILIGDTPRDIEAAREAGAKVIAVCGNFPKEKLIAAKPDLLLDSMEEIERFLEFVG